jgi:peptide/nickel transport system permease protein
VFLLLIVLLAALAPFVSPYSPWDMVQRPFLPPMNMTGFPLGTDTMGRDIWSDLAYGARVSLLIGVVSTVFGLLVGTGIGAFAGFYGGWVDSALMRFTELFQAIPSFAMAIVLVAIFQPSVVSIVISIAVVSWPPIARLVRGEFLTLRNRDFVAAAKLGGESDLRIMCTQILPNAAAPIIVMGALMVATAILLESSLSFMGLGDPNVMSWGYMIGAGRTSLREAWWISLFPGVAILLTVLALNFIGDGLSDGLNMRKDVRSRA